MEWKIERAEHKTGFVTFAMTVVLEMIIKVRRKVLLKHSAN